MNRELEEATKALDDLEFDAGLLATHDIGATGSTRMLANLSILRRFLLAAALVVLALWILTLAGCGFTTRTTPLPAGDLVAAPGVSAPVIEATRARLTVEGTPIRDGGTLSLSANDPAFDCQAAARALIPWKGPSFTDPRFFAANEALLPDAPEFASRRAAACAILKADALSR